MRNKDKNNIGVWHVTQITSRLLIHSSGTKVQRENFRSGFHADNIATIAGK